MKKVFFFKLRQKSQQNHFHCDLVLMLNTSLTQAVSIENYKIRLFRSDYTHIPMYLCRVSFLITLNIYKDYFKGRQETMQKIIHTESNLVHHSLWRSYFIFTLRVLWLRSFRSSLLMKWRTLLPTSSSSWWS